MNPNVKLATMFAVVALAAIGTTATTAFAQPPEEPGIEEADDNVHFNTGDLSEQDVRFHEGLCQAGIETDALVDLAGSCEEFREADHFPGESGDVRQD